MLFIQFPPLAKNTIMASPEVASLFLVVFSIGVAIGSVAINALLKGRVSARYSPISVIVMGVFVVAFYVVAKLWEADQPTSLLSVQEFIAWPMAAVLLLCLLGIAVAGGMFVVPLYAFLTTRVSPDKASRTIAANNIVNSGAMVAGSLVAMGMSAVGNSYHRAGAAMRLYVLVLGVARQAPGGSGKRGGRTGRRDAHLSRQVR